LVFIRNYKGSALGDGHCHVVVVDDEVLRSWQHDVCITHHRDVENKILLKSVCLARAGLFQFGGRHYASIDDL
jgi:hypothetical protein